MLKRGNIMVWFGGTRSGGLIARRRRSQASGWDAKAKFAILSAGMTLVLVEHAMTDAAADDAIRVRIDPADLHVFYPATGAAIVRKKE